MNFQHRSNFENASENGTFLYESLITHNYCKTVVEIGVAFGTTTVYLCKGANAIGGHVFGFDIWEQHGIWNQHVQIGSKETTEEYVNYPEPFCLQNEFGASRKEC